jgi:tRNA-modifying protein YgfZ
MPIAHLADRGVVSVTGEDAKTFLDGLLTCDLDRVAPGRPRYGALLSPQGKILFDFILFQDGEGGYFFDCAQAQAADLARRLGFYKLRAKAAVADRSGTMAVIAGWGAARKPGDLALAADDPRLAELGWRAIVPAGEATRMEVDAAVYHAHRIALGVPEGGKDFSFGGAFPHEALMDQLHGIDSDKGCYVGQEVVSRMEHRGTARTRIVPLVYVEGSPPAAGSEVTAGGRMVGASGSGAGARGLAMLRLDKVADALAAGETLRVAGLPVHLHKPGWITFPFPDEAATPAA